jgi:putative ABC transport system substrate-binding protein
MERRRFIALLSGAAAWSPAAVAQQNAIPIIGYLSTASPGSVAPFVTAFRQGLSEAGFVDGKNVTIEFDWAENQPDRLSRLAADLANRRVDLIVTGGGPLAALAAKQRTSTIPIFFIAVGDPVSIGLVNSLARPGGNATGFSILVVELNAKRFELLSELVPKATVIGLLVNPNSSSTDRIVRDVEQAARAKGVELAVLRASSEAEIGEAFASLNPLRAAALLVGSDPVFNNRREQIVALASRYAIPAIHEFRESVEIGGLISYGPDQTYFNHQAGIYAGRILRGEKPADIPVEQPTKLELIVNLKTAMTLGLTVPPSILARADEVIE